MERVRAKLAGVVQGVGLRPTAVRLARVHGLCGWVRNERDGALLDVEAEPAALEAFFCALLRALPDGARITTRVALPARGARGFHIEPSEQGSAGRSSLPADRAPCAQCAAELWGEGRRRHYAFVSCTRCGPRWSVAGAGPWDRERTTMAPFVMCADCAREYADVDDRRGHAQTLACPACGPRLTLLGSDGRVLGSGPDALALAAQALRAGAIVALKGVGGHQLLCDAGSDAAVAELRRRKAREAKPFALLLSTCLDVECVALPTAAEWAALQDATAPIVLVRTRAGAPLAQAVAEGSPFTGAMLPASPLHALIARAIGRPLVCTSANLADEPIIVSDGDARAMLGSLADLLLTHDRAISHALDDSVVRITRRERVMLRRARGFAPLCLSRNEPGARVLALGAQLKSTVAFARDDEFWISPHIGDLSGSASRARLEAAARELLRMAGKAPDAVACDAHPDYASTELAERLARELGVPLVRVPHHGAHVAAVVAEHSLRDPVLGLAWDGVGLGDDGTLWGGEALRLDGPELTRVASLSPFRLPGGEAAIREPRRAALGLLCSLGLGSEPVARWFSPRERALLEHACAHAINAPVTSSVGRLFDAVAALTGLLGRSRYEAEAALCVEQCARDEPLFVEGYAIELSGSGPARVQTAALVHALLADLAGGADVGHVCARFHATLTQMAVLSVGVSDTRVVALGGGCFQNARLLDATRARLEDLGYSVHTARELPAGDGGLSVGQALLAARRLEHVPGRSR